MSILFDLQKKENFTEAEKAAAQYILDHLEEIADLNIGEIADQSHTSNATIIRLCRRLGTKGYRDFRISILREIEKIPDEDYQGNVDYPVYDRTSLAIVMKSLAEVHKYAVSTCYTAVSAVDLQNAAFILERAEHIYIYATGESDLAGQVFARRMMRIGHRCMCISSTTESLAFTDQLTAKDAALFISYSGKGIIRFRDDMILMEQRKVRTVLLTGVTPNHPFSQIIRYPYIESDDDNSATFYSTEAENYLLDSIYSMIFAMEYEKVKKHKQEVDHLMRQRADLYIDKMQK
ncbi:MAG: MurR/RpiR family transcriptional regulator [Lactimicrobium sp.]|jgi:RpiR family carbohydrate utilization transcriptional regulator|uniref:MurR/RpiR family transcriptional regulator n=1 Tax=Lactimicrobium sp. TaxID=2563780 RepID=UPI002F3531B9